ncbi:MAG: Hsp20 family protein [Alphaproteobacteria bacterium]
MPRDSIFGSPLLLGFDHLERILDGISKVGNDGYPPYNVEQIGESRLRITLAIAGFTMDDLSVTVEENQLIVRGKQEEDAGKTYLHRGIAARQFQRTFLLAEGIEVVGATLDNGLLHVDLARPIPAAQRKTIAIQLTEGRSRGKRKVLKASDAKRAEEES